MDEDVKAADGSEEAARSESMRKPDEAPEVKHNGGFGARDDMINHPAHYTFGMYEVIDILEEWFGSDPLLWQVGKYLARAGRKGDMLEDLLKARWYLERRISKETAARK